MRLLIGSLLLVLSLTTSAVTEIEKSKHSDCFSGTFQSYKKFSHMLLEKNKSLTPERLDKLISEKKYINAKEHLDCNNIVYLSDGFNIPGFMITPKKMGKKKLPIIVYNRGGNSSFGAIVFGSLFFDLFPLAQQGYIVVASQYRGVYEAEPKRFGKDEFGGRDVNDVHKLIDMVKQHPNADPNNIFVYGVSRGGMMSYLVARERNDIRAMAVIAGPTDLIGGLDWRPEMENVYKARIPNYSLHKESELKKRSVLNWVNELPKQTPILLLHGEADKRVNVKDSIKLNERLDKATIKNKLIIYSKDDHSLRRNRNKARASIIEWFRENSEPEYDSQEKNR
ncbi:MAG: prolyl oligopeptidase family serine peptidase [Kangiellaceae bacterium]